jgi:hypothetical protein
MVELGRALQENSVCRSALLDGRYSKEAVRGPLPRCLLCCSSGALLRRICLVPPSSCLVHVSASRKLLTGAPSGPLCRAPVPHAVPRMRPHSLASLHRCFPRSRPRRTAAYQAVPAAHQAAPLSANPYPPPTKQHPLLQAPCTCRPSSRTALPADPCRR